MNLFGFYGYDIHQMVGWVNAPTVRADHGGLWLHDIDRFHSASNGSATAWVRLPGEGIYNNVSSIDGFGTPWLYFNASHDPRFGASLPQGPADSLALAGKLWIQQDDQRTLFVPKGARSSFAYCHNLSSTVSKLRRNLLLAAYHGHAHYAYQKESLYADPAQPELTARLWKQLGEIRREAARLGRAPARASPAAPRSPPVLAAEVAVFTDDESALHLRLQLGVHHGSEDQRPDPTVHWPGSDPLSWNQDMLDDPLLALGTLGAPMRQYMLADLMLPACADAAPRTGCIPLDRLRLAVFPNAHVLPAALRASIAAKLASRNVTLVFLFAAGIIDEHGRADPEGIRGATGIAALRRGNGSVAQNLTFAPGASRLAGWFGPLERTDPWYYLDEGEGAAANATVLARYSANGLAAAARVVLPGTAAAPSHAVVFSSAPTLPTPLWRELAQHAGVHTYMADEDAIVDVDLSGSRLYVGHAAEHWRPWIQRGVRAAGPSRAQGCAVALPAPAGRVAYSNGTLVCTGCATWAQACGTSEAYVVTS